MPSAELEPKSRLLRAGAGSAEFVVLQLPENFQLQLPENVITTFRKIAMVDRMWVFSMLVAAVSGSGLIVLEPPVKGGVEKVVVLINGFEVSNALYEETGAALQSFASRSNVSLWVALPSFTNDIPNPGELPTAIDDALASVATKGFAAERSRDVFLAGHAMGGDYAQREVVSRSYAGLVLLGSSLATSSPPSRRRR